MAYTAGTRANEATHLCWGDIDFADPKIRIIAKPDVGELEAWRPKDCDSRTVPVPAGTIDLLSRVQAEAPAGGTYVFLSPERVAWIKRKRQAGTWGEGQDVLNNLDKNFKRNARAAGVQDISLHDLRRSAITNWARALPTSVVQQLAGHADIKTAMRFYVSVGDDDLAKAREIIARALLLDPNLGNAHPTGTLAQTKTGLAIPYGRFLNVPVRIRT